VLVEAFREQKALPEETLTNRIFRNNLATIYHLQGLLSEPKDIFEALPARLKVPRRRSQQRFW
jgi:hypothetical protein